MALDAELVRGQVDRVIHSRTFETSEVHRRLLQYLAEKTLAGEADRMKEYTIGIEAFGKPPSYDPKLDSIVRLQVSRLRQKLAAYYQSEGASDAMVVGVPKGAFKLTFEPAGSAPHPDLVSETPPSRWRTVPVLSVALAVAIVWALVASVSLVRLQRTQPPPAERWTPELEALWEPLLDAKRPLLVSLGSPLFLRIPTLGFFRDPRTNDPQDAATSDRVAALRKAFGEPEVLLVNPFTGTGEASAAFLIAKRLAARRPDITLTRSSIVSWQQIADDNLVFVGPPKFSPQLRAAELTYDIVVEADGIRNRKPHAGEPEFLPDRIVSMPSRPSEGETHAVISRIPGLSGVGDIMILGGNASPDTLAAAEWLTQPWRAAELVQHLRSTPGGMPRYFQVVVKVVFKQGVPVQSSYVFHHALGR
jgi:hypothetical protein